MTSSTVTYQGETLESLRGQLNYTQDALNSNLENWERKEFEVVKTEIEFKIQSIIDILDSRPEGYVSCFISGPQSNYQCEY